MLVVDPTLEALWQQVIDDWDEDERHGKFLAYAQQTKELGDAARLYRSVTEEGSTHRLSEDQLLDAKKRLAGVAMLAAMDLDSQKSDPTEVPGRLAVRVVGYVIVLGLFAALAWLLLQR